MLAAGINMVVRTVALLREIMQERETPRWAIFFHPDSYIVSLS